MSTIQPLNTNAKLVEADGTPSQTTIAFNEALRKRLNKAALLPATATVADLINALGDE